MKNSSRWAVGLIAAVAILGTPGGVAGTRQEPLQTFAEGSCLPPSLNSLCLAGGRFRVEVFWETPTGQSGRGQAVQLTDDSGYMWFFNSNNVEAVLKVLNACSLNNRYWVFAAGLTNVRTEIQVTDTATNVMKVYINPQATPFQPIQDTDAFATCP